MKADGRYVRFQPMGTVVKVGMKMKKFRTGWIVGSVALVGFVMLGYLILSQDRGRHQAHEGTGSYDAVPSKVSGSSGEARQQAGAALTGTTLTGTAAAAGGTPGTPSVPGSPTKPSGPSTASADGFFDGLADLAAKQLPTHVTDIRDRMCMDMSGFKESSDLEVQALLSRYNHEVSRIAALSFEGNNTWTCGTAKFSISHDIKFRRDGFEVIQKNEDMVSTIKNGVVMHHKLQAPYYICSYYLLPLAGYNPSEFRSGGAEPLQVLDYYNGQKTESVATVKLESDKCTLYFGRDDGRLRRVALHDRRDAEDYARVDFFDHTTSNDVKYPLRTQITILKNDGRFGEYADQPPFYGVLEINKDSLKAGS
jgi:hypothetical protein